MVSDEKLIVCYSNSLYPQTNRKTDCRNIFRCSPFFTLYY